MSDVVQRLMLDLCPSVHRHERGVESAFGLGTHNATRYR